MKMKVFNEIHLNIKLPSNNINALVLTLSSLHLLSSSSLLWLQIPITMVVLKMVMAWGITFFFGEKSQKGDNAQILNWKSLFFLKSICQSVPPFKDWVATNIPIGYTFNALGKKYR